MGTCLFMICEFCKTRCFVPDPRYPGLASARLATCEGGAEFDKETIGYSWDEVSREYCFCKKMGAFPHPKHDVGGREAPARSSIDDGAHPDDACLEPHESSAELTCGCIVRRLDDGSVTFTHCFRSGA